MFHGCRHGGRPSPPHYDDLPLPAPLPQPRLQPLPPSLRKPRRGSTASAAMDVVVEPSPHRAPLATSTRALGMACPPPCAALPDLSCSPSSSSSRAKFVVVTLLHRHCLPATSTLTPPMFCPRTRTSPLRPATLTRSPDPVRPCLVRSSGPPPHAYGPQAASAQLPSRRPSSSMRWLSPSGEAHAA